MLQFSVQVIVAAAFVILLMAEALVYELIKEYV